MRRFDPVAFRDALRAAQFTTEGLARVTGISASYLGHVRCGSVPGADIRRRLASVLFVDEEALWPVVDETEVA